MNYWAFICPEREHLGLWHAWQEESVVTIGWGPRYLEEHPDQRAPTAGYGAAESLIRQMQPGDQIIPFLRENRIGRVATFRKQRIDEWIPVLTEDQDQGRRIDVMWQIENMPPADRVALIPVALRRNPIRRTVARLSPERFAELTAVLGDEANWQDLQMLREASGLLEDESAADTQFPLERHLEEFIEANFSRINFGRRLKLYQDDENTGRQFPTGVGSIDLLAQDLGSGQLVVIELKKTRSDDAVVGQVLRYMGWIREHPPQANSGVVGIIIVSEMSDRLRYALSMLSNVSAFVYSVSFALSPGQ